MLTALGIACLAAAFGLLAFVRSTFYGGRLFGCMALLMVLGIMFIFVGISPLPP